MGWIKAKRPTTQRSDQTSSSFSLKATSIQHIESLALDEPAFAIQPESVPDEALPYISADLVKRQNGKRSSRLWVVIDDIIYDCTTFVHDHPGGTTVLESFGGAECSWQFWKFHSRDNLCQYGARLRVGKTKGMVNRFEERAAYVGLRELGDDNF